MDTVDPPKDPGQPNAWACEVIQSEMRRAWIVLTQMIAERDGKTVARDQENYLARARKWLEAEMLRIVFLPPNASKSNNAMTRFSINWTDGERKLAMMSKEDKILLTAMNIVLRHASGRFIESVRRYTSDE
jgi:hypothetical protein